jgi:hypothetical protein
MTGKKEKEIPLPGLWGNLQPRWNELFKLVEEAEE